MDFWDTAVDVGLGVGTGGTGLLVKKGLESAGGGSIGRAIGTSVDRPGTAPVYGDIGEETPAKRERDRYRGMGYTNYQGIGAQVGQEQRWRGQEQYNNAYNSRQAQTESLQAGHNALRYQEGSIANQQRGLAEYEAAMTGNRPSVAQIQQQQGLDAAVRNQMAMAASARGGGANLAAAQAAGARAGQEMQMQGISQSAALRAHEMEAARAGYVGAAQGITGSLGQISQGWQGLGNQFSGMRGQDLQAMNASDQMALAQRQSQMQDEGLKMQNQQFYENLGHQVNMAAMGANQYNQALQQQVNMQEAQNRQNLFMGFMGSVTGGAGTAFSGGGGGAAGGGLGKSDPMVKTNASPATGLGMTTEPQLASEPPNVMTRPPEKKSGGASSLAAMLPMLMSDPSAKRASTEGQATADNFLGSLSRAAASYNYTDPSYEPRSQPTGGKYLGVMADQIEQTPGIGQQLVSRDARGLRQIENGAMVSALAAGTGRLAERVAALETKRRK